MSRYGYLLPGHHDAEDEPDDNDEGVTCRRCGATGLEWINTGVRWRLMDDAGKFHVCAAKADPSDFKDESGG